MLDAIKYFLGALFEGLGIVRDRSAQKNSPAMQANAVARTDQQIVDDATSAVAKNDLDEIRKEAAE